MNNSLGLLLSDDPISITTNLKLYQPKVRDVVNMGEEYYNLLLRIWTLNRNDLVTVENEYTQNKSDYEIWLDYMLSNDKMKDALETSCLIFFHKKVEFFPLTHTMYIGEADTGVLLDLNLYLSIKALFSKLDFNKTQDTDKQYKETDHMSEREKRIYERLKAGERKLQKIKEDENDPDDIFGKQIVALAAIGHYTFSEVYDMTMLQFSTLLQKYVEIDNYEIRMMLSPYISSKDDNQENKHWLN